MRAVRESEGRHSENIFEDPRAAKEIELCN